MTLTPEPLAGKIALGTVPFGLPYGMANSGGQVPPLKVRRILGAAHASGIELLHAAEADGTAKTVLGAAGIGGYAVVGWVGRIAAPHELAGRVRALLGRLGAKHLDGLLLHNPDQLPDLPGLAGALDALKAEELADEVGWSVYSPEQTARLLATIPADPVQLPLQAIDDRWGATLDRLEVLGVGIHLRSAFLQGLLVMLQPPAWTAPLADLLASWHDWVTAQGTTPARAGLALAIGQPVKRVVIVVNNAAQIADILDLQPLPALLGTTDARLLDPRLWGRA